MEISARSVRKNMSEPEMRNLVDKELQKDPTGSLGVRALTGRIRMETGVHIPR